MSIFGEEWDIGKDIARFGCHTNGPCKSYEVVMRLCYYGTSMTPYRVIYDPFENRLMWFNDDRIGILESNNVFSHLVALAMCDSEAEHGKVH